MIQKTQICTQYMGDLWRLPVIRKAYKDDDRRTFVVFNDGYRHVRLTDGDTVIYDTETEEWGVMLSASSLEFNGRFPCTTKVRR